MKKIGFALLFITVSVFAKVNVISTIVPEAEFIKAIGGDDVAVTLMVLPGEEPETYAPKPSQMKSISHADLYMSMGVEFDNSWLPRFKGMNKKMKIIELAKGIKKRPIMGEAPTANEGLDPHIWNAPSKIKVIALNILNGLSKADSANSAKYKKNYQKFIQKVEQTDKKITALLSKLPKEDKSFIVFHPAWGYFAREYGLKQIPIEVGGKSPKPRIVKNLIKEAKRLKIHTILTAPEFSDAIAKQIAKEIGGKTLKISPLNPDWSNNLINLAKAISSESTVTKK